MEGPHQVGPSVSSQAISNAMSAVLSRASYDSWGEQFINPQMANRRHSCVTGPYIFAILPEWSVSAHTVQWCLPLTKWTHLGVSMYEYLELSDSGFVFQ